MVGDEGRASDLWGLWREPLDPQHITALPQISVQGSSAVDDRTYLVLVTCDDCGATLLFDIARDMLAHKARVRHV